MKANRGKLYYELVSDKLILKNTPVPLYPKPAEQYKINLNSIVLGDDYGADGVIPRIVDRIKLLRILREYFLNTPDISAKFEGRFIDAIQLFIAIVDEIRDACFKNKVKLCLMLMPGRSFVERPDSTSSQYQNYLREKIVENKEKMDVDVIDLAIHLRERYKIKHGKRFYPNEGHLTAEGHSVVSDILLPMLQ